MKIRVAYACDEKYAPLATISAVSLLKHNPGAAIVFLGYELCPSTLDKVKSRIECAGGFFEYRDVSRAIANVASTGTSEYSSYAVYARLFIAEAICGEGKVLYLDCDTLVTGSLEELFSMPLNGKLCAMGVDCIPFAYHKFVNMDKDSTYFNTGVMLIDLCQWRKRRCLERFLDEVKKPHGPNPLGDQDIIVRLFSKDTVPLLPKWNCLSQFLLLSYGGLKRVVAPQTLPFGESEYDESRCDCRICHFSGHTLGRPWYRESRHPMRERYRAAAKEAGFPDIAEQSRPLPPSYALQYQLHRILPQRLFDIVCFCLYRVHILLNYHV